MPFGDYTINLTGLQPLVRRIRRLEGKRVRARIIKNGLNAGARVIKKQMKANAPKRTGELRKSIGIETKVSGTVSTGETKIGPLKGSKGIRYAHLTESGTVVRSTKGRRGTSSKGHTTGFVRGTRWMERAFNTSESKALDAMAERMEDEIIKAVSGG